MFLGIKFSYNKVYFSLLIFSILSSKLYGGLQDVKMNTLDGVDGNTDGVLLGGSVEGGVAFEMQENLVLEPSVRVLYNLINYDNMSDKYGKTARFDDVQNLELEAGVKIEKTWFTDNNSVVKLFVKPAVIQNFGSGDVSITSLETI